MENTIKQQSPVKRVAYLDMLKCLGMFIVVQGHIHSQYGWFSLPLHCYVIPLYFLLSGLTFRRSKFPTFGEFAKHRAKTLLLPYVMFSVVTWLVWAPYNYITQDSTVTGYWAPLLQTLFAQGSGRFLVHNVPLWFVPCLFIIESLYYFIDKLPKWANLLTCVACAFVGVWMIAGPYSNVLTLLPWSMESAFAAIIFYCVGNLLTKMWSLDEVETYVVKHKWFAILAIVILTPALVLSSYWNGHVSLGSDLLGKSPLIFYVNAFVGIVTIFLFSILVCAIPRKNKLWKSIIDFHLFFGKNSFYIMATHFPIKCVLVAIMAKVLQVSVGYIVNEYITAAIVFAITCTISSILAIYIGKLKVRNHLWVEKGRQSIKK